MINGQLEESTKNCFFCNRYFKDINSISSCCHNICDDCLYEKIFTNYIKDFQGQSTITIRCNCEKGFIEKKLPEVLEILKKKSENINTNNKMLDYENIEICSEHKMEKDQCCLDCFQLACEKCSTDVESKHYCHRILNYDYIINFTKDNISQMHLKNKDLDSFLEKCNEMSVKFQEVINKNFNNSVQKIDDIIDSAIKLKENYINQYKEQLGNYIQTFKIIKILYMNFYNDKSLELSKNNKENNIFTLRYLNNISYELSGLEIKHNQDIDNLAISIKKKLDEITKSKFKYLSTNFIFEKIKKKFEIDDIISNSHSQFINAMSLTNDNKIITCGRDYYMKIWKQDGKNFYEFQSKKNPILCVLPLKNGNFLTTASNNNDINVWGLNKDGDGYEKKQSMTIHSKAVYSLAELGNKKILSTSLDNSICIWEENDKQQYSVTQRLYSNKPIIVSSSLQNSKFALTGDDGIIKIYGANTTYENHKLTTQEFKEIGELKYHLGRVSCMCQLKNGYLISGGSDKKEKKDHNIIVWKPEGNLFVLSQILKDHEADVNSVIELRCGKFASCSKDRTIRIWASSRNIENRVSYYSTEKIDHYGHGLYKLIQLKDDRLCTTATDNNLIFWKNRESLF